MGSKIYFTLLIILLYILKVQANNYLILNCTHFQAINFDLTGNYDLVNDIDCSNTNFLVIGSSTLPFKGTLNGNNRR